MENLSKTELMEVNGGISCPWCGPAGLVLAILLTDWDEVADDIKRGWADAHK